MIPLSYNLRSLTARKTTTIATAAGIGLVVFVLAGAMMLLNGLHQTLGNSGRSDDGFVLRKGADGELASTIDNPTVSLILAAPGVKQGKDGKPLGAGEVVVVVALEKDGAPGQMSNVQIRGVTDNVLELRPEVRILEGRAPQPGTDEVMIGAKIRGRFVGLDLDQSFDLKKNRPVKVVGVFEDKGSAFESEVWGDLETIRSSFGRGTMVSSVTARLEDGAKFDGFAATIESDKALGLDAMRETEYYTKQSEGLSAFIGGLGFAIAIFFALGAMIGAAITMYGAVAQRSREIGTLRALGFARSAVLFSFLSESVMLALIGGGLGVVGALGLKFASFSMLNFNTWSEIVFTFSPTPKILITSLVIGGIMGFIGGLAPAVRAARISPIDAMRS